MRTVYEARASTVLYRLSAARPADAGVYLLPANICPVVPLALLAAGRDFEFIDLDPETLCLDERLLHARVTAGDGPPVAGVIYVRTYGVQFDAASLFRGLRARDPGLLLIDDRCLCRPQPDPGEVDAQGADAVVFSTGYAKPVDLGLGGFAHLRREVPYDQSGFDFVPEELARITTLYHTASAERRPLFRGQPDDAFCRRLSRPGWLDSRPPELSWFSYRGRLLEKGFAADEHRRRINDIYRRHVPTGLRLPDGYHGWRFQARVPDRDAIIEAIFAAGLFASAHYYPASRLFGDHPRPVADALHEDILNLFNDFRVSAKVAARIGRIVASNLTIADDRIRETK